MKSCAAAQHHAASAQQLPHIHLPSAINGDFGTDSSAKISLEITQHPDLTAPFQPDCKVPRGKHVLPLWHLISLAHEVLVPAQVGSFQQSLLQLSDRSDTWREEMQENSEEKGCCSQLNSFCQHSSSSVPVEHWVTARWPHEPDPNPEDASRGLLWECGRPACKQACPSYPHIYYTSGWMRPAVSLPHTDPSSQGVLAAVIKLMLITYYLYRWLGRKLTIKIPAASSQRTSKLESMKLL